ncbi:hypothetical protein LFL96_24885 [Paraburkholderia sp. D15]|uniref:hypothetical protein n=1 Tax=Paraburkholderia sp. D15 TaxID=2880218 RepID=UPI00247ABC5C|nr:hypothetical protein [Paraburkholderia sp. D15]WGS54262.1 hypothetical protein LFL96_24885 [Paraburkholderia sp. D15]WKF60193.1 hypothetical protein HUO10_004711 [Paraburkholderia busanensis]
MLRHTFSSHRRAVVSILLATSAGALSGCSDSMSDADIAFVTANMPPQFQSMRMYGAVPDNAPLGSSNSHTTGRLRQACQAIIRAQGQDVRQTVILEDEPGDSFDFDATRTSDGLNVTSDGLRPPSVDPVGFRTRFTTCVNAIRDKYAAEPEKAPFK